MQIRQLHVSGAISMTIRKKDCMVVEDGILMSIWLYKSTAYQARKCKPQGQNTERACSTGLWKDAEFASVQSDNGSWLSVLELGPHPTDRCTVLWRYTPCRLHYAQVSTSCNATLNASQGLPLYNRWQQSSVCNRATSSTLDTFSKRLDACDIYALTLDFTSRKPSRWSAFNVSPVYIAVAN